MYKKRDGALKKLGYLLFPIRSSTSQMTEAGNFLLKIYLWFENNVSKLTKLKKKLNVGLLNLQRMLKQRNDLQYLNTVCFVLFYKYYKCFLPDLFALPQMKIMIPF